MGFFSDASSSGFSTGPAMAGARPAASARRAGNTPRFHKASEPRPPSGAACEPTRTRAAHVVSRQRARARARSAQRRAVAGGNGLVGTTFVPQRGPALPKRTRWRVRSTARPPVGCLAVLGVKMEGKRQETEASALVGRCSACGLWRADAPWRVCRRSAVRARSASGSGTRRRRAPPANLLTLQRRRLPA